jgi:uncharacterized membrane protein YqhA
MLVVRSQVTGGITICPHRRGDLWTHVLLTQRRGTMASESADKPVADNAERVLASFLWLAIIPVVVLSLAALGAFVYGTLVFVHSVRGIVDHPFPVGHQVGLFLLDVDLFFIGATLLICAVGFYELFIRKIRFDESTKLPAWLEMRDLNDLKGRVIAMVVLVLSITFAEVVVDAPTGDYVLKLGGGIALVIVALTAFLRLTMHAREDS